MLYQHIRPTCYLRNWAVGSIYAMRFHIGRVWKREEERTIEENWTERERENKGFLVRMFEYVRPFGHVQSDDGFGEFQLCEWNQLKMSDKIERRIDLSAVFHYGLFIPLLSSLRRGNFFTFVSLRTFDIWFFQNDLCAVWFMILSLCCRFFSSVTIVSWIKLNAKNYSLNENVMPFHGRTRTHFTYISTWGQDTALIHDKNDEKKNDERSKFKTKITNIRQIYNFIFYICDWDERLEYLLFVLYSSVCRLKPSH